MSKQSDLERLIREDMHQTKEAINLLDSVVDPDEPALTPVSPYHNIRLALSGKTAPFINMPLGTTRVYVERVG